MRHAQHQLTQRQAFVFQPLQTHDEVLQQEFSKGECSGISTFREFVPATLELLDHLISSKDEETQQ